MNVKEQLERDEGGMRLRAYKDSQGIWTIGVGHNLESRPIPREAAELIFEADLADTILEVDRVLPWAAALDAPRRAVLINMAFNIGVAGLLEHNPKMLAAAKRGDYAEAARELLDGPYKDQVGPRAHRLAQQMESGNWV